MKRILLIVLSVSLLLVMVTATVWAAPGAGKSIQGDTGDTTAQEPLPAEEEAAGSLEKAIGTLGLFAAMMAVLALGTEVVIDTTKYMIGLKSKPTALESLEKFGDQLPGQLSELGVSGKEVSRLEEVIADMKEVLQPLNYPVQLTDALREGDLGDAIKAAEEWAKAANIDLQGAKTGLKQAAETGIRGLAARLGVDGTAAAQTAITNVKNTLEGLDVNETATTKLLEALRSEVPELGLAWLKRQIEALPDEEPLEQRRTKIMSGFDAEVAPTLKAMGLDDSRIQTLRDHFDTVLAKAAGQLHLKALENLLQGVENVRFDIQSPLRKTWRRLRDSKFPPLVQWINAIRKWRHMRELDTKGNWSKLLSNLYIGKPFELLERFWNFLLGRTPGEGNTLDRADRVEPLTNATAAQRLLQAETKHQDEEASRRRVLRVISIFVGVYLAFRLQVNAVDILAEAFKGIAQINQTVNTEVVVGWLNWPLQQLNRLAFFNFRVFTLDQTTLLLADEMRLDAGILLSGLAASAGSAFWHDQLEKLQVAKKGMAQVQQVVESVKKAQA